MARYRALILAIAATAAFAIPAAAQNLQRLTVTQLTLASDTPNPQFEKPFHLIVTARVRERVTALENIDLPILAELELLGDEHRLSSDASGTTYREAITVIAHHTGEITIAPVTLDAIDARDGKPKRYSSNALTIDVGGGPVAAVDTAGSLIKTSFTWLLWGLGIGAIAVIVVVLLRRPRGKMPQPPPAEFVQQLPTAVARDPRSRLRDALVTLRADPNRNTAMRVRSLARGLVGASDVETLHDVLERPAAREPQMRDLLRALERAAFTHDAGLQAAIAEAIRQLERMTA